MTLLPKVGEGNMTANMISFIAAISACKRRQAVEACTAILEKMRSEGMTPNVISFSVAISACKEGEQWERALPLLKRMRRMARNR